MYVYSDMQKGVRSLNGFMACKFIQKIKRKTFQNYLFSSLEYNFEVIMN